MLARRSVLIHPLTGSRIDLPLVVPAFSSKGFAMMETGKGRSKHPYSQVADELALFANAPSDAVMVSAYDLHFGHLDGPDVPCHDPLSCLRGCRALFIDSGGYELGPDLNATAQNRANRSPREGYGLPEYALVLNQLQKRNDLLPLVVTNFDFETQGQPIKKQIERGRSLFRNAQNCLTDFILKPWEGSQGLVAPSCMSDEDFEDLRGFDIIGVTEKELGRDLLGSLRALAQIRVRLSKATVTAPIHVVGGLDPVLMPLYFFAGGEIFDGLSWLRYAFHEGMAVYRRCYPILNAELGLETDYRSNKTLTPMHNLRFLARLSTKLEQWVDSKGSKFDFEAPVNGYLEKAYDVMKAKIPELGRRS